MDTKQDWNIGEGGSLPLGFGLNLAANADAMNVFANMTDDERQHTIEESRKQHTKNDMEDFVIRLGETDQNGIYPT